MAQPIVHASQQLSVDVHRQVDDGVVRQGGRDDILCTQTL